MRKRPSYWIVAGAVVLAAACALAVAQTGGEKTPDLDSARDTLARWVETQQIISRERGDWQVGKEVLDERISLVDNEIAKLEERIVETRANITDTDTRRRELVDENEELKRASANLVQVIDGLETKTRTLLATLPDPIRERVEPLSRRIPADPANTELSLSERFQNVVGILNEINKFNRDITVTSEVRTMPDGSSAEVKALYIGLGQAYYVTANGNAAGVGHPGPEGWTWTPANEIAPDVAQVIAILQNEQVPAFVPLPVEIQ